MFYINANLYDDSVAISDKPDPEFVKNVYPTLEEAVRFRGNWIVYQADLEDLKRPLQKLNLPCTRLISLGVCPVGIVSDDIPQLRGDAFGYAVTTIQNAPGGPEDTFERLGRPWIWRYYLGLGGKEPTPLQWKLANEEERRTGVMTEPLPRGKSSRPVRDRQTGEEWPSVVEAAHAIGAHKVTIYNHLRGDQSYQTVRGRLLEWAPDRPLPGSWDAKTEAEKEEGRRAAAALGYTLKV